MKTEKLNYPNAVNEIDISILVKDSINHKLNRIIYQQQFKYIHQHNLKTNGRSFKERFYDC